MRSGKLPHPLLYPVTGRLCSLSNLLPVVGRHPISRDYHSNYTVTGISDHKYTLSCHVVSCYVVLWRVVLCCVMMRRVMLCHDVSCYVVLCCVMTCRVVYPDHLILRHVTSLWIIHLVKNCFNAALKFRSRVKTIRNRWRNAEHRCRSNETLKRQLAS